MTKEELAKYIDHTLLAPDATENQICLLCQEARSYGFASVCINPCYVSLAKKELQKTDIKVCTVIGFPLGANTTKIKCLEAKNAISNGADEVDMVINIGKAKQGDFSFIESEIKAVFRVVQNEKTKRNRPILLKVIMETCLIDDDTLVNCCLCAKKAGADFVKTSTGFASPKDTNGRGLPNGASEHHVKIMRKTVGDSIGVKASGGIRSSKMAALMIKSGANRIGTSSGVNIVNNWDDSLNCY